MLIVLGELAFDPDHLSILRSAIVDLVAASRRDAGCLFYAWAEDVIEPGVIRMIEHWESRAAFEAHDASSAAAKWKALLAPYGLLRRHMTAHEASDLEEI